MSGDHERIPASDYTAHRCPDTAHRCPDWDGLMIDCNDDEYVCCTCPQYNGKREWNYLTYAEMREIVDTHAIAVATVMVELAEAIEAKVKEKNA